MSRTQNGAQNGTRNGTHGAGKGKGGQGASGSATEAPASAQVTRDASPAAATGGEKSVVQVIEELQAQVGRAADGEVQARARLGSVLDRVELLLARTNQGRASLVAMSLEAQGETTRMALAHNAERLERVALECQQLLQGCGREVKRPAAHEGTVTRPYAMQV